MRTPNAKRKNTVAVTQYTTGHDTAPHRTFIHIYIRGIPDTKVLFWINPHVKMRADGNNYCNVKSRQAHCRCTEITT